jgi:hypothetical protein
VRQGAVGAEALRGPETSCGGHKKPASSTGAWTRFPPQRHGLSGVLVTGRGRGHDLHLRTLQARGVTLTGHFLGATDRKVLFAPDLDQSVAWGDQRYSTRGLEPPALDDPEPFTSSARDSIDLADIGSVIFAAGFRPDYRSSLPWPDAFDTWDSR